MFILADDSKVWDQRNVLPKKKPINNYGNCLKYFESKYGVKDFFKTIFKNFLLIKNHWNHSLLEDVFRHIIVWFTLLNKQLLNIT